MRQASKVLAAIVFCVIVASTFAHSWTKTEEAQVKNALPNWVIWEDRLLSADLDGNGTLETVSLHDKTLEIMDVQGETVSRLPEGRYTSDVFVQDIDFDGEQEIVALTWKKGSYGPYHPFWQTDADDSMTQHIFIFTYEDEQLHDKWLSSDIGIEIASLMLDPYGRFHATLLDGAQEIIEWQSWGLTYLDTDTPSWNDQRYDAASILVMGDVIAHNVILQQAQSAALGKGEFDFSFLFQDIAPIVQEANLAIVNQEGPLVEENKLINGSSYSFGTPAQMAQAYKGAGFDVLALANNHMMDRGVEGIASTLNIIQSAGLGSVGITQNGEIEPFIIECNGIRLGIVNAADPIFDLGDMVQSYADEEAFLESITKLHDQTDFLVCMLHIGEEYIEEPADADREFIARVIDAGADAVVCAHSHVVQPVERITTSQGRSGIVFYGLGNLVSGQTLPGTQDGLCARFVLAKSKDDADVRACVLTYQAVPTACTMDNGVTTVYFE